MSFNFCCKHCGLYMPFCVKEMNGCHSGIPFAARASSKLFVTKTLTAGAGQYVSINQKTMKGWTLSPSSFCGLRCGFAVCGNLASGPLLSVSAR